MADYGVPDDNDRVLPWSWAEERLVVTADSTVEVVSLEGVAARDDGRYSDDVLDAYLVTPQVAYGVIERRDNFGPCATRWRWPALKHR